MNRLLFLFSLITLYISHVSSLVTVPKIFSDGAVFQCNTAYDQRPFVYGNADVNEIVIVNRTAPGGGVQTYSAVADNTTFWIVTLNTDSCNDPNE